MSVIDTVMRRNDALLLILLVALTGGTMGQGVAILQSWPSPPLPATDLFRGALLWIWLPLLAVASVSGLWGGYRAVLDGHLATPLLLVSQAVACFVLKVDGYELGWSALRVSVTAGDDRVHLGINFVALLLLSLLLRARARPTVRQAASRRAQEQDVRPK